MGTYVTMTPDLLQPGERVLDHDGDLFTIEEVRVVGREVALVDDAGQVLWLMADEPLFLDAVLPRVWRFEDMPGVDGKSARLFAEHLQVGDVVQVDDQRVCIDGMAIVGGAVTLYEEGEAVRTLDAGTIVEVLP